MRAAPRRAAPRCAVTPPPPRPPRCRHNAAFAHTTTHPPLPAPHPSSPFCTIDPHVSKVPVPDERFDALVSAHKPKSVVPAVLTVTDIAGLVKGAAEGAGLGNAFLSNIQAVDGIFHVCRAFAGDEIVHVEGRVDPVADLEIIHNELRLKDAATLATQIESKRKGVERGLGGKDAKAEFVSLEKIAAWVGEGKDVRMGEWGAIDVEVLNKLQLLTAKPVVYLVNLSEKDYIRKRNKFLEPLAAWVKALGQEDKILPFSCEFEAKIFEMEPEAREAYCKEHATKSIMPRIIKTGYHALGLVHFFTAGPDEVRAWTIKEATPAPNAAGTIHTDFLKNFIAAESAWGQGTLSLPGSPVSYLARPLPALPPVYSYDDWKANNQSEAEVKAAGKYHTKGKLYEIQDGDICFFKIGQ